MINYSVNQQLDIFTFINTINTTTKSAKISHSSKSDVLENTPKSLNSRMHLYKIKEIANYFLQAEEYKGMDVLDGPDYEMKYPLKNGYYVGLGYFIYGEDDYEVCVTLYNKSDDYLCVHGGPLSSSILCPANIESITAAIDTLLDSIYGESFFYCVDPNSFYVVTAKGERKSIRPITSIMASLSQAVPYKQFNAALAALYAKGLRISPEYTAVEFDILEIRSTDFRTVKHKCSHAALFNECATNAFHFGDKDLLCQYASSTRSVIHSCNRLDALKNKNLTCKEVNHMYHRFYRDGFYVPHATTFAVKLHSGSLEIASEVYNQKAKMQEKDSILSAAVA